MSSMKDNKITPEIVDQMKYVDFISLIKETNRCPGGKESIRKIIQNSFINKDSRVLEIGSNTGFTSLEIARNVKCNVIGIDVNRNCVKEAIENLKNDVPEIREKVNFKIGSAYDIPFKDGTFDLVIAGGATSFMEDKEKAVSEYSRVLKKWGFLSVTQLFYKKKPPETLLRDISSLIGTKINPWSEKEWLKVYESSNPLIELYFYEKNELSSRPEDTIDNYISYFMSKPHLQDYSKEIREKIKLKWKRYIELFNENHNYLGYFIALFRNRACPEEPELFIKKND